MTDEAERPPPLRVGAHEVKVSLCKSCKAQIVWAITPKGKRLPIDLAPNPLGNWLLSLGADGTVKAKYEAQLKGRDSWGAKLTFRETHWSTCPESAEWKAKVKQVQQQLGWVPEKEEEP